ncbi:MAG: response regulator [Deltaproteobacteria bacterium]|nr:response regulator [Deltaproteobacteria bacterium]
MDDTRPHTAHQIQATRAVDADRVRLLCTQAWIGSVANIATALIAFFLTLSAMESVLIGALPYAGVVFVYLARLFHVGLHQPPQDDEIPKWRHYMFFSSLLAGILWGSVGCLVLPQVDLPRQLLLVLIGSGVSAGAVSTLAPVYPVFLAFTLPIFGGLTAGYLYAGIFQPYGVGALILVFAALVMKTGRHQETSIARALWFSREKDALVLDLTEARAQAEEARALAEEAQHEAEMASAAKSTFLAKMSHELRTPLHGVLGMIELLRVSSMPTKEREFADTAHASGQTLLAILDDLLDLAKIEAQKVELEHTSFSLSQLMDEVCALFELQATAKGLVLHRDLPADLPDAVLGDGARLRQVLVNLLANAVKFTEQGSITVMVKRDHQRPVNALTFTVRDTGIGVAHDAKAQLFDAFQQADNTVSRRYGGTGLGLAIAHQIVSLMGGELQLKSEDGQGSEFTFCVELPPVHQASSACERRPPSIESAPLSLREDATILIVDDNSINRAVAKEMVTHLGHEAVLAESGAEAIKWMKRRAFALVLMDCEMPEMSGLEAAQAINLLMLKTPAGRKLPIVALTAHAIETHAEKCREAGMCDVLTKPVSLAELEQCLVRWCPTTS